MKQTSHLTDHQLAHARGLLKGGRMSQAAVAATLGVSAPTLCRWLKTGSGGDGETRRLGDGETGRGSISKSPCLPVSESSVLKRLYLQTRSRRLAAEDFLHDEACSHETALAIQAVLDNAATKRQRPAWPVWFQRATILTHEERLLFRGAKAGQAIEPARPRGAFYEIVEDGAVKRVPLFAGALWESDDQSENTPSLSIDPATGRPQLNRQTLYTVDSYSAFILGFHSVQRVKDAYTLEDQADHALELCDAHGLPIAWRIERGPWDNNFWFGIPLPREWWRTEECAAFRWGGLDLSAGGPIRVLQAKKSREKGLIEGTFNHLQNLNAHTSRDIGRFRGEHERAAKMAAKVQSLKDRNAPVTEAEIVKLREMFPDAWHRAELTLAGVQRFNHEAKQRTMHGKRLLVPAELFREAVKRELPADERWRFLPVKRTATVRNAHLTFTVSQHEQRVFLFSVEGFKPAWNGDAYLPSGWNVLCAFHPLRPDVGCHIFNGVHPDDPRNKGRFPLGMFLGVAPAVSMAPQFRVGGLLDNEEDPFKARKQHMKTVRRESRTMRADVPRVVRGSLAMVGGNLEVSRTGAPDPLRSLSQQTETDMSGSRNLADHEVGSGEIGGRADRDHEVRTNNSTGSRMSLTELEAREREMLEAEGILT